jgi:F-type H+-transporting ATPase subunit a
MANKINTFRNTIAVTSLFFLFTAFLPLFASTEGAVQPQGEQPTMAGEHPAEAAQFNAGEMIINHIKDAHDWHLFDLSHKNEDGTEEIHAVSIPLPIILLIPGEGLKVFSSSKFDHGHAAYDGYKLSNGMIEKEDGSRKQATLFNLGLGNQNLFYDFSITKNVAAMILAIIILSLVFFTVAKSYKNRPKSAPKGLQSFVEPLIMFIRDEVAKPSIGAHYEKFMPYLLTIFFFIFVNNLMGLIPIFPFGANVTGNIAVTLVLAAFTFILTLFSGNKSYWGHLFAPPGVPAWLLPIMIPIEILGVISKPVVLMLRLFANITAGHIIILAFFSLIFIFGASVGPGVAYGVSVASVIFTVFMNFLELLVAFLQAYVFTLLSALYFGMAVHEEHHHAEEHSGH